VNVDEMDLASRLKDAAPLRPEAYERARATLRAAMAEPGPARVPELVSGPGAAPLRREEPSRAGNRRRTVGTWGKAGIGAGISAVAAAVAIVLAATPATRPATPAGSASPAPAVTASLVSLAAHITADSGPLPGNASLIIRTQTIGSRRPDVTYSLYTDSGAIYSGDDKITLMRAVARHQNLADGMDSRDVKVALYAATGNLTAARKQMATVSPGDLWLGLAGRAQRAAWEKAIAQEWPTLKAKGIKTPPKLPAGQALQSIVNNRVWDNSVEALSAGGGNPRVRTGVLRLLSTIPQVTVAKSTTGGQPTLTLTAGSALFGGSSREVLTINAETGMPIKSTEPAQGNVPSSVTTYQVSRVTLGAIEAGKF
jgi:hypothetical protein